MTVVVGSGVAGLSCALALAEAGDEVELVSAGVLREPRETSAGRRLAGGNTALAQGGIAAAIGPGDTPEAHLADTLAAGASLVDAEAAEILVRDGAAAVRALIAAGFGIDRDPAGGPEFGLEGAHDRPRIVHARGDRTGAALHDFLRERVLGAVRDGRIGLTESHRVHALQLDSGAVRGIVLRDASGAEQQRRADAVVLATGGYAAHFPRTTNHSGARGEGIVVAARAGAAIADLEFVQFHPTVLHGSGQLISEAVRGAGAVLRDGSGKRFMVGAHPLAELAPRDVVSHEIERVLRERGESCVWLDATPIERSGGAGSLARQFPGVHAAVESRGIDWTRDPVPVSPAAHYTMGGVVSDLDGRSTLPGLYAAGEVASTGVHGANRLASNSLLEGLVFGVRAARAVARDTGGMGWELRGAGARRLEREAEVAEAVPECADADDDLLTAMIDVAGRRRTESRGAHLRSDYPDTDPRQAERRAYRLAVVRSDGDAGGAGAADILVGALRTEISC